MHALLMVGTVFGLIVPLFTTPVKAGSAVVYSNCNYEVVCALVDGVDPHILNPAPPAAPAFQAVGGGFHVDGFLPNVGQVIHCAKSTDTSHPALLEWTWNTTETTLWWDASVVDGDPFHNEGLAVGTDQPQPPTGQPSPYDRCWNSYCPAGGCDTAQVYHNADDDREPEDNPMRACRPETNLIWEIRGIHASRRRALPAAPVRFTA